MKVIPNRFMIMNLKNQLRFYIEHKVMTATQLAKKANVPKQSLSGWLSGNSPRDLNQLKRVADALNTSVDNLMFGEGVEEPKQKVTELEALLGDQWISGIFEIRFRRVRGK